MNTTVEQNPNVQAPSRVLRALLIPTTQLRPDPKQPRRTFDPNELRALAASIAEQGVVQPLIVRHRPAPFTLHPPQSEGAAWTAVDTATGAVSEAPTENLLVLSCGGEAAFGEYYEILAGERRWRAAQLAELDLVPCMVRNLSDPKDILALQFAENEYREGLSAMDEAVTFDRIVNEDRLMSADELAEQIGRSRSHIYERIKLAHTSKELQQAVAEKKIDPSLATLVAQLPDEYHESVLDYVSIEEPSHRRLQQHIEDCYKRNLEQAPFDISDCGLVPTAGSCNACPKKSGKSTCLDVNCYEDKMKRANAIREKQIKETQKAMEVKASKRVEQTDAETPEPEDEITEQAANDHAREVAKARNFIAMVNEWNEEQRVHKKRSIQDKVSKAVAAHLAKPIKTAQQEQALWVWTLELIMNLLEKCHQPMPRHLFHQYGITELEMEGFQAAETETLKKLALELLMRNFDAFERLEPKYFGINVSNLQLLEEKRYEQANALPSNGETIEITDAYLADQLEGIINADQVKYGIIRGTIEWRRERWICEGVNYDPKGKNSYQCRRLLPEWRPENSPKSPGDRVTYDGDCVGYVVGPSITLVYDEYKANKAKASKPVQSSKAGKKGKGIKK